MQGVPPSVMNLKMLNNVPEDILDQGNVNNTPGLQIIQKISSDYNARNDRDKDFWKFVMKLIYEYEEKWKSKSNPGFIQQCGIKPLTVVMFTQKQIDYLVFVPPEDAWAYLDATARLVALPRGVKGKLMYFVLILKASEKRGPFVVAEFLSTSQSVPFIKLFLNIVARAVRQKTNRCVIRKMETDFGLAIIHAAVWAFNNMSLSQYLKLTFYLLKKHDKGPLYFMILHMCSSHILKTVKRKGKNLHMTKSHIFLALKVA